MMLHHQSSMSSPTIGTLDGIMVIMTTVVTNDVSVDLPIGAGDLHKLQLGCSGSRASPALCSITQAVGTQQHLVNLVGHQRCVCAAQILGILGIPMSMLVVQIPPQTSYLCLSAQTARRTNNIPR